MSALVELALEGLRYDDLIRWKEAEIRLPQDVLGARFIAGEWGSVSPGSLEDKLTAQNVLIVEEGTSRVLRSEEGLPLSHSEQRYCPEPRECRTESQLEITVNQLLR